MSLHTHDNLVLLPYKITLLSNAATVAADTFIVLLPYKITLLSNRTALSFGRRRVLLPYKITLLSNAKCRKRSYR